MPLDEDDTVSERTGGFRGYILSKERSLSGSLKRYNWNRILIFYSLALMVTLLITRCFNNNFWCDECYTILLSDYDFIPMIERESWDMHPPLYHIIFFVFCRLFGSTPFIYHFVSYVPYAIAIILTVTVLKKEYGVGFSLMMVTFISLLSSSLNYVQDARMYEWGMLFILCAFASAMSLMKKNRRKDYVFFAV